MILIPLDWRVRDPRRRTPFYTSSARAAACKVFCARAALACSHRIINLPQPVALSFCSSLFSSLHAAHSKHNPLPAWDCPCTAVHLLACTHTAGRQPHAAHKRRHVVLLWHHGCQSHTHTHLHALPCNAGT